MVNQDLWRLYRLRAIKNGALFASWAGVFFACLAWYGYGQGWFEGGVVGGHAWQAALLGYAFGALCGMGAATSTHINEPFEERVRRLRELDERVDDDQEFLEAEMRRLKREVLLWNPLVWPFALLHSIFMALRPIPQPRPSAD